MIGIPIFYVETEVFEMGRKKLQPVELVEDAPLTDGLSVNLNAMTEHRLEIMA